MEEIFFLGLIILNFFIIFLLLLRTNEFLKLSKIWKKINLNIILFGNQLRLKRLQNLVINNLYAHAYIYQSQQARISQLLDELSEIVGWHINSFWQFDEKGQFVEI